MNEASPEHEITGRSHIFGQLGAQWGVLGVSALLLFAVYRMGPYALDLSWRALSSIQRVELLGFLLLMVVGKGYFGLHRSFSPKVAARARHIAVEPQPLRVLLAPLYGMSLIQAPGRRMLIGWGVMGLIAPLVPIIQHLPWPWRNIVDAGVVAGLCLGLLSLWWYAWVRPLVVRVAALRTGH